MGISSVVIKVECQICGEREETLLEEEDPLDAFFNYRSFLASLRRKGWEIEEGRAICPDCLEDLHESLLEG